MERQKTRDEIEEKYKWDLSTIFKTEEEFLKFYDEVKKEINKIDSYKGKIRDRCSKGSY